MELMIEEPILVEDAPVQEDVKEESPVAVETAPIKPAGKKRGPKPKIAAPPPPVEAVKPRKRRIASIAAKMSKGEKAIAAAISNAQIERVKAIAECAKVIQIQGAKESVLKSVEWQIAMLTGAPLSSPTQVQTPNYPLPPQFPQPPAYPHPAAPAYLPPGMRTPALPQVPGAQGGAIGGIVEAQVDSEEPFLEESGVMGGRGWK